MWVQGEWCFSCQWEPERPDGFISLAGLDVSQRGAKPPAEQEEAQMWLCFDFQGEPWPVKYFDLIFTVHFLTSTMQRLSQWSEMPWLNLHWFLVSY